MPDYKVGTLKLFGELGTDFLFQTSNLYIATDHSEAPDENGNTAAVQDFNHRAVADMEAVIPRGTGLPVTGQTVQVKGVTLPTVTSDGVVSGTFAMDSQITSSSTAVNFRVTGEPRVTAQNNAFTHFSMQATRWLVNGLPTSSGGSGTT